MKDGRRRMDGMDEHLYDCLVGSHIKHNNVVLYCIIMHRIILQIVRLQIRLQRSLQNTRNAWDERWSERMDEWTNICLVGSHKII